MTISPQNFNSGTAVSLDRLHWLKSVASLTVLARFGSIFPSVFPARLPKINNLDDQEGQHTVNQESVAALWLEPQIGFQLAHEQFKVPELVALGIAADQAGFDIFSR